MARRLVQEGCARFFVATLAEARQLRAIVRDAVIYVLEGVVEDGAEELASIAATPVLNSIPQIQRWAGRGRAVKRRFALPNDGSL